MPRVAVVGTGLVGGSLLLRLHAAGRDVIGWDPAESTRDLGRARGLTFADTMPGALGGAGLVFLCGPLVSLPDTLAEVVAHTGDDCVVTDVGSAKAAVAAAGQDVDRFVPGHPMAGAEQAGLAAASAGLFQDAPWVLCPEPAVSLRHYRALVRELTSAFGAHVVPMPAGHHDRVVALASHIPHLLAGALAGAVGDSGVRAGVLGLAAGSFRDGTRVAGAPVDRTADMVLQNRAAVLDQIGLVRAALDALTGAVAADDRGALLRCLGAGRDVRAELLARPAAEVERRFALDTERDFLIDVGTRGGHLVDCVVESTSVRYRAVLSPTR